MTEDKRIIYGEPDRMSDHDIWLDDTVASGIIALRTRRDVVYLSRNDVSSIVGLLRRWLDTGAMVDEEVE